MSSYQVLYRRFRPHDFQSIVGQAPIVGILKNQIRKGRVGHAYLFCGSRGTGKTSTAKVFAKAANCLSPKSGEACGACAYCLSYQDGGFSDVVEIDAASNRGIDEIRELRDKVSLMPSLGRYRVYIVDEVHMLTAEAFNALLKTLEEPPSHAVFIFCTTDPAKVPATILSRCQRFDFARVGNSEMTDRMASIAEELGIACEKGALSFIAQNSDGAMRDALGHLDKAISAMEGETLTLEGAAASMGAASGRLISQIGLACAKGEAEAALLALDGALKGGRDPSGVFGQLVEWHRSLLIYITTKNPQALLSKSEEEMESYEEARVYVSAGRMIAAIKELSHAKADSRHLQFPRYLLEATVASLADSGSPLEAESLASRVERLEAALAQLRASPVPPAPKAPTEPAAPAKEAGAPSLPPREAETAGAALESGAQPTLDELQKAILFASRYVLNKERSQILSQIFGLLRASSYEGGVLTVVPVGDAVSMMEAFESKKGAEKLSSILEEQSGYKAKIEVRLSASPPSVDVMGAAKALLGEMTEFSDE
jgi:DNA polymerase-3 subunit gamma/tau